MGNTANAYGELTFDDVYSFPGDMNDLAAFANRFAHVRRGAAADRAALLPGQIRDGMLFLETEGDVYLRRGGSWARVIGDTGWVELPMSNGWVNFGGAYGNARYRRVNGIVYLTGLVKSGTTTPGTTIGALPAGFRPASYTMKPAAISGGTGNLDVSPAGLIIASSVSATFTSLEFSFPAEQ